MPPQAWFNAFTVYLVTVLLGTVIGVSAYMRFLKRIREHHAEHFQELGSPHILMGSPRKSMLLQKFIYTRGIYHESDPELRSISRFLAVFTPILLVTVLVVSTWWVVLTFQLVI